jgi:protein TonB
MSMRALGPLFAVLMGAAVTLALLFTMQALIGTAAPGVDAGARVRIADLTLRGQHRDALPEPGRPQRLPDPARPPRVDLPMVGGFGASAPVALDGRAGAAPGLHSGAVVAAVPADADYLPIVKVAAVYPRRAQARGISGHCTVEYTVTASGATRDPVVIDCQPPGVFEEASLRAALKFKYRPRVVDGRPVEVSGVRNQFVFELDP